MNYARGSIIQGQLQRVLQAHLALPNIAGEMSLVTNGITTANIEIEGEVEAIVIEINEFYDLIKHLKLSKELLELIHHRFKGHIVQEENIGSVEVVNKIKGIFHQVQHPFHREILQQIVTCIQGKEFSFIQKRYKEGSLIIEQTREKKIPPGECSVFLLVRGSVGAYKRSEEGEPIFFHTLEQGAILGEMALLTGSRIRSARIVTHENSEVIEISENDFLAILNESPELHSVFQELSRQRLLQEGVTQNAEAKMQFMEINRSNAQKLLGQCIADEEMDGLSRLELRRACLYNDPEISTSRAYTRSILPIKNTSIFLTEQKKKHKQELHGSERWINARLSFHESLQSAWRQKIRESHSLLQEVIQRAFPELSNKRILFLLSGNTGVGKSYLLRNLSLLDARLSNLNISAISVVSTDTVRAAIRSEEGYDERGNLKISSAQCQSEAAWITEGLITWALSENLNIMIDKRYLTLEDVNETTAPAKQKGNFAVIMVDVDAELQTSLDRVFGNFVKNIPGRDPNGPDPIPPRQLIEQDYAKAVFYRAAKSQLEEIDEYYLIKSDMRCADLLPFKVAYRHAAHEPLVIADEHRYFFYHATRDTQWDLLVSQCAHSIQKMRRTIAAQRSEAADYAHHNLQGILEYLFTNRDIKFANPKKLQEFLEQIAIEVSRSILKNEAPLYRNSDSSKFAYTKVEQLQEAMRAFVNEFYDRLHEGGQDPIQLAAWIEYKIDLTDHFFQDGCGRISKILSAWVLVRFCGHSVTLPNYRGCEEYYKHSPANGDTEYREKYFPHWLDYYRTLFSHRF